MEISENIKYIGCDDTDIDLFESQYKVPNGVSYNSYVILDEKVAVMETADGRVTDRWFENLQNALGGRTPDYLIVSHMEPDHARNIGRFLETYPTAKIVGNAKTFVMFPQYFPNDITDRKIVVKEGDELNLGKHVLTFIMAPMVHWPEVMMEYEKTEKILFSADGFGKFGALCFEEDWTDEARRYYCNIVGKYGAMVQGILKKAATLDIKTICPLHGPVLTDNLGYYLEKYDKWSSYTPEEEGVVIAYASIHGNTAGAAKTLAQMLEKQGKKAVVYDLSRADMAQVVAEAFRYDKLVLACSTYDGDIFSPMRDFLHRIKAKSVQNRMVGIIENGSWAPQAAKHIKEELSSMKEMIVLEPVVTIRGAVKEETLAALNALAEKL